MTGIVIELQKEAMDNSVPVSNLLRKALAVARKLKNSEIEKWIRSELNGYETGPFPEYRKIHGEIKSKNVVTGEMMPVNFLGFKPEIVENLMERSTGQPIAELEAIISKASVRELMISFEPALGMQLMKGSSMQVPPVLMVQTAALHRIVDTVRNTVLEWALDLESSGVIGENFSFTEEDKRAASHVTINIGTMTHSQIQAETTHSQQILAVNRIDPAQLLAFIAEARSHLASLGLQKLAKDELVSELDTLEAQAKSPKPKNGIIRDSLQSITNILQGAAGGAIAEGLVSGVRILLGS